MTYGEAAYGEAGYGESPPAATAASYAATVLADSPLAYYRLDETSGTAIADSSGNGRHGTASASVVSAASLIADPTDKSIDFNKNNRVSVPNAAWMDVLTFSAEAWINADGTNSAQGLIVGRANDSGGGGDSRRSFKITTHGSGQAITYLLRFTNGTFLEATTNTAIFGVTSHIVLTWDGTWARLYKNGVEIHSTNAHAGKTLGFPAQPLTIGQDAGGFSTTRADARIDEVAYYGHALTPERVLAHYNAGAPPTSLTVAVGQATETDSAQSLTRLTNVPVGQASEADSAQGIAALTSANVLVGQATETDSAQGIAALTSANIPVGQTTETDSAQEIAPLTPAAPTNVPVGQAGEVDSANPIVTAAPYVLFDDYNRVNSTNTPGTPITGGPYTVRTGTWGIINNALYTSASTSEAHMTFPGSADFDARLKLDVPGSNGGLLFRWIDTNNCWLVQWNPTQLMLHRRVAGTYAQMSPSFTRTLTPTDELRVVAFGAFIWVFINDNLLITLYDGFTAGYAASTMGFRFSSSTNTRLNEISVRSAMAAPVADGTADLANPEAAGADPFTGVLLYKGRDTYLADEGAEA